MRYTGSIFKKSRRYGISLLENNKEFLKGKKRTTAPGQHGDKKVKLTGYGEQLREKQRLQYMYGITDRQFRRMFSIAEKMKGNLSMNLLIVLESRLDNLVYRMGFAPTRKAARQLVSHGHILLNGKKCDIPSTIVALKDSIEVKEKSKKLPVVNTNEIIKPLGFVEVSADKKGTYLRYPQRPELNLDINETYVVEWYTRLI
ncbi:MAG: 30S ribosomal protein S4 [Mycoplasmataceae bacterium]|nr:30S ribosomal protein S4 [Mycoplasmataceae bacterium]